MAAGREQLTINFKKKRASWSLLVFGFMDNGHYISYVPSLNLTGYGDTKEEAKDLLMKYVTKDFFEGFFTLDESKALEELRKLGWAKSAFFHKEFSKSYVDKSGILRKFNLPAETQIESQLISAA